MSSVARQFLTFQEYLALEETSVVKHEFVGGVAYAMAGARASHNRMVARWASALEPPARASGCDTFIADMKLRIGDGVVYYPDLMVCCDETDDDELCRTSPCLIIEVLSPGTAVIDRREKLNGYLALPSLLTYLIVDPDVPMVEAHSRASPEQPWNHETHGRHGVISLTCPAVGVDVATLYS